MKKITKINKIKGFKIFQDFEWDRYCKNASKNMDFKKFNLIYGWNGSGKTTLSSIFHDLELKKATHFGIELQLEDGSKMTGKDFDSSNYSVKVFNGDFVKNNVFTLDEKAKPIFILGEDSAEKQKEIEKLKKELNSTNEHKKQLNNKKSTEEKNKLAIETAKKIKEILLSLSATDYRNYDKRRYEQKAEDLIKLGIYQTKILSEIDQNNYREKVKQDKKAAIKEITLGINEIELLSLKKQTNETMKKVVSSQVIERLQNDSRLQNWVKQGLEQHIHADNNICPFCEQTLSNSFNEKLNAHFNDEFQSFSKNIDKQIAELESKKKIEVIYPELHYFYSDLAQKYKEAKNQLNNLIEEYKKVISLLIDCLKKKKDNPFTELSLDIDVPNLPISMKLDFLNRIIRNNNNTSNNIEDEIKKARIALEEHYVAETIEQYKKLSNDIDFTEKECQKIDREIEETREKIQRLEQEIKDHRTPAENINRDINSYLGRRDISIKPLDDGYILTRNGSDSKFKTLSEGEKTALAFIYFINSLQNKDFNLQESIVVIDDPISSLDENAIFHAFGFMKECVRNAGQVFILTHSFSFFRQIKNWFSHINKYAKKNGETANFYMLKTKYIDETRNSLLLPLDEMLLCFESEYHYLFNTVLDYSENPSDKHLAAYYHIPNIARKLLEGFLAFHIPNSQGLNQKLEKIDFDSDKKTIIIRFLHTYSHNDHMSIDSESDLSVLSETPKILKNLLALIEHCDKKHFDIMKETVAKNIANNDCKNLK